MCELRPFLAWLIRGRRERLGAIICFFDSIIEGEQNNGKFRRLDSWLAEGDASRDWESGATFKNNNGISVDFESSPSPKMR
jgi:hypothetical protein